ncbi:hypothetical protein PT974_07571 [Cladobotryum mycophilum]|uniref:Indole-diterpene biosynthesis protein PaxU n=1 Tax=Cladobotryum mycophilum TaxID=491253 RepID=A0ABR0SQY6_9HYPO
MASSSPAAAAPGGLEPLRAIGENYFVFEPETPNEANDGPSLIVMCTWMVGATPRRLQKYIAGYRALWPHAAILLVTPRQLDFTLLPSSMLHANMVPARDVIHRHIDRQAAGQAYKPSILLHIFSNGGLFMAVNLALSLQVRHEGRPPLDLGPHIRGIMLDCAPGLTEFWRTYNAAVVGLPKSLPAQVVGRTFYAVVTGLLVNGHRTGILRGSIDTMRQKVNDPGLFGSARRLYLYSEADQVIGWEDIEAHMEEARSKRGFTVESVKFTDSPHCALVLHDPTRYWNAIERFWTRTGESPGDDFLSAGVPRSRL